MKNIDFRVVDPLINLALNEDLPWGDITTESLIDPDQVSELAIVLKEEGIVAGLPVAKRVFQAVGSEFSWEQLSKEGECLKKDTVLVKIKGKTHSLLKSERLALNFLQRLSGIATLSSHFVQAAKKGSSSVKVVDTRKTTPGHRYLEKYAVRMGGAYNHRYSLSDSILIKDNHIAAIKNDKRSLIDAIFSVRQKCSHTIKIGVEVDRIDQIPEALKAGVDAILLDNMTNDELKRAVALIKGKALSEASGGVSLKSITGIAQTGVDIISVGALTHSAPSLDIGFDYL